MKQTKTKRKRNNILVLSVIALAVLGAVLYFSLSSESSFFNLYRSSMKNREMAQEISRLNEAVDSLNETIEKLKSDTTYIERIAREKLGMAKNGEKVYKFVDKKK